MLIITIHVNAPAGQALGLKEAIAGRLEVLGDVRVADVQEVLPEQIKMEG